MEELIKFYNRTQEKHQRLRNTNRNPSNNLNDSISTSSFPSMTANNNSLQQQLVQTFTNVGALRWMGPTMYNRIRGTKDGGDSDDDLSTRSNSVTSSSKHNENNNNKTVSNNV